MSSVTIPPMNESDRDRDPQEDYEYGLKLMRVPSSALHAWIRRAVAAEADRDRLLAAAKAALFLWDRDESIEPFQGEVEQVRAAIAGR